MEAETMADLIGELKALRERWIKTLIAEGTIKVGKAYSMEILEWRIKMIELIEDLSFLIKGFELPRKSNEE